MDLLFGRAPATGGRTGSGKEEGTGTGRSKKGQPLWLEIREGEDSYLDGEVFGRFVKGAGRSFSFDGETRAIIAKKGQEVVNYDTGELITLRGDEVFKRLSVFGPHHTNTQESFAEFLRENAYYGSPRPGSYFSAFHEQFFSPRIKRSINSVFAHNSKYAWQGALEHGPLQGSWKRYDLNQAYLWSTTQGLPDCRTLRASSKLGVLPGLYSLTIIPDLSLPYPFDRFENVNASTEEIDAYGLHIRRIHGGVVWQGIEPEDLCTSVIKQFSFAKDVSKGFWGRWASEEPLEISTHAGSRWTVPNNKLNLVWAHMVVSRVKMRLFNVVRTHRTAHVYVDSVITTGELPTGTSLGEWKLEKEYRDGLFVGWPGGYGPRAGNLDSHTGVKYAA